MPATASSLDMSNVTERSGDYNPRRLKEGDYLARITEVKDGKSKKDDGAQWVFTLVPEEHRNAKYPYYCKLQENQLWKVRNILVAAGISVPKKKVKVDPNRVVGKLVAISLEDDEYEGKEKSTVAAIFPASELQDGSSDADVPDDDDDAEDTEDDDTATDTDDDDEEVGDDEEEEEDTDPFLEMDRAALKAYIVVAQPDFKAKKSQTDDDLRGIAREITTTTSDDEEEEDEEPAPPSVKKAAKKANKAVAKKKAAVDDDDLEELDIDDV